MIDFLAKILGYVMYACYWLTNNYVVSLLLFALIMQLLMLPLGIKQQKNMVKQASLRPKEMAIRKKYSGRNDKVTLQKMQTEIQELYQREGYSQFAGCLPMLVQLIIVFPLYQVVIRPLEFISGLGKDACAKLAELLELSGSTTQIEISGKLHAGWLPDASVMVGEGEGAYSLLEAVQNMKIVPDVSLFGVELGGTPMAAFGEKYWWLIFIPIFNLAVSYLSQYISKKLSYKNPMAEEAQMGGSMKIMMLVLPLMTMFITFNFAAAIGVYWIFRTLISMLQQFVLAKTMPYPQFTEEDFKKAERELKGSSKKGSKNNYVSDGEARPYRSLHHIDDDE